MKIEYRCNECGKTAELPEVKTKWLYHTDDFNIYCPKCVRKLKNLFEEFTKRKSK